MHIFIQTVNTQQFSTQQQLPKLASTITNQERMHNQTKHGKAIALNQILARERGNGSITTRYTSQLLKQMLPSYSKLRMKLQQLMKHLPCIKM